VFAGLADLGGQRGRLVGDPHGVQHLAGVGHPHDHRPAPVQIDTHNLAAVVVCVHEGPPSP
jgi:hypothetical protein